MSARTASSFQRIVRGSTAWRESPFYCWLREGRGSEAAVTDHAQTFGCIPCLFDSRNLQPPPMYLPVPDYPLPLPGEGACPRCKGLVQLRLQPDGLVRVVDADGRAHRHEPMSPIYLTGRARLEPTDEPPPRPTPPWERWR